MAKIRKLSLVDQTYQRIREDILQLRLPLGSHINVNDIQEELGVSSTPLREALNRLQQEGLVVIENNIGASVLTLDAHDVEEIEELSFVLQSAAVRFSLARGDRERMAADIAEEIAHYRSARSGQESVSAVFGLIGTFYHYSGNQRLDSSMLAIQGEVLLLRYIYAECPGSRSNADLLERMLSGVRENKADKVLEALQEYNRRSRPAILAWLEQHQG